MNRIDALRLGAVLAIVVYLSYRIAQEYADRMAAAGEIDTVLGLVGFQISFVLDATWFIVTEPVLLVASVVYLLLVWPSVQPPY